MKFEFLYDRGNQRFYRASKIITKGTSFGREVDVTTEYKDLIQSILERKPHLTYLNGQSPNIVCISDAHTHDERLVFLGCEIPKESNDGHPYGRLSVQIGGEYTMLIHGGDSKTMRDDKVYLRRLAILNKENKL